MDNYLERFTSTLTDVCERIATCPETSFNQEVKNQFFMQCDALKDSLQDIANQERLLRIGIVGSVKAGKSTFLNSLLFDGQEVLPRAATPMTASLTFLRYTQESPSATLIYYTEKDWARIQDIAIEGNRQLKVNFKEECNKAIRKKMEQYGTNVPLTEDEKGNIYKRLYSKLLIEVRSCIELVDKCKESGLNVASYLGKKEIIEFQSTDAIRGELEKYIGSGGLLTPLVRSVELNIAHEALRDIEIIDTPGLNDPVVSRSQETKKHLGKCDVVFLLSMTSHFLGAEDVEFIRRSLPEEGIRHTVVIASQIDNGVLDFLNLSFLEAYKKSGLNAKAQFNKLKGSFPGETQFTAISAMLAACAYKKQKGLPLDKEESHALNQLKRFHDFNDSSENLHSYSGLAKFTEDILPATRRRRVQIKETRQAEMLVTKQAATEIAINKLLTSAQSFYSDIQTQDVKQLETQKAYIHEAFRSVKIDVNSAFSAAATKINQNITTLENALIRLIDNYTEIRVEQAKHTSREFWETGSLWWKKSGYDTVTTYVDTASVSDILEQMRKYSTDAQGRINDFYLNIININSLKQVIKQTLVNLFRDQDNFNEDRILVPLEAALGGIGISPFRFDNDSYNERIEKLYAEGKIEGAEIYKLRKDFERTMQDIGKAITQQLISEGAKISYRLEQLAENFLKNIEKSVQDDIQKISEMLCDKEKSMRMCQETIAILQSCQQQVAALR